MENKETHVHKFTKHEIPSTCKEHGYTLQKCECGYEHKDNFKPLAPHKFEVIEETKPTCAEAGIQKLRCTVCGEIQEKQLSPLGHAWDEWIVESFATCTEEGKQFRTCKRCGTKEDAIIKAKGHKLTNPKKSITEKGMIDYFCTNCGQTISLPSKSTKFKSFLTKHKKKVTLIASSVAAVLVIGFSSFIATEFILPRYHYSAAKKAIEEKEYLDAYSHLNKCIGYKNSNELRDDFVVYYERTSNQNETTGIKKFKYNKNGDLTHVYGYSSDGKLANTTEFKYKYDKNGNITQVTKNYTGSDNESECMYESLYKYNDDGTLDEIVTHDNNGETTFTFYTKDGNIKTSGKWDSSDNLISEIVYDENGNIVTKFDGKHTFYYNKKGNLVDVKLANQLEKFKRNPITGNCEIQRYANERLVEKRCYDKNGNPTKIVCYTYKKNLRKITSETKYKYDSNGTAILYETYGANGKLYVKYENDKYGNRTLQEQHNYDPIASRKNITKYKYDSHGIMTKESCKAKISHDNKKLPTNKLFDYQYHEPIVWYCPGR